MSEGIMAVAREMSRRTRSCLHRIVLATALSILVPVSPGLASEPGFGRVDVQATHTTTGSPALPDALEQATIRVGRGDGRWVRVLNDSITIQFAYYAEMKRGYITNYHFGHIWQGNRVTVRFLPDEPWYMAATAIAGDLEETFSSGDLSAVEQEEIVSACNREASADNGFELSFDYAVAFQVDARRRRRPVVSSPGDYTGYGDSARQLVTGVVPIRVACEPPVQRAEAPPDPVTIDLRVEQFGDTCPKRTEVTSFIDYEEQSTASFRIRHNDRLSDLISIKARRVELGGKRWYRVKRVETYHLDPGLHEFRVEMPAGKRSKPASVRITCPPFQVTSAWLTYDVADGTTCPKEVKEVATFKATRPGSFDYEVKHQGGLVVHSGTARARRRGREYVATVKRHLTLDELEADIMAAVKNAPANSGWTRLEIACLDVLGGTLDLRGPVSGSCPRDAEAAISFRTDLAGPVPWRLDCTGGRSRQGTAEARRTAPDTYVAVAIASLPIAASEQVNCALKSLVTGEPRVVAAKGEHYRCARPR
jgi:hypothetical protein